ncbi:MAG: SulP family inorganic anion transporter [Firmicutes bacterium]|nr:SulP family inorganic anion transporter [Bacillota bacterium]
MRLSPGGTLPALFCCLLAVLAAGLPGATTISGVSSLKSWWERVRGDVIGGATAAVVALPLALAFGIASGAGAVAGLYASIFGGLTAAVFGGCGVQITGPTGAMTAVLVSIVSGHGVGGMLLAGALAGLMQVALGFLRLGKFVKFLPQPVIAGFTNGVSILFFMTAIGDALQTPSITLITTLAILLALRFFKQAPESLFGLIAGLIVNELFVHTPHVVGDLPFSIPQPALALMPFGDVGQLIRPAITICLLGSISALLSAEVTDGMIGSQHNSNRELIGQGLGNLVSSLVGGVPVSGAVARSGVNVYSGGRTRLSSILHAVFLLLIVLVLGPVAKRIPLASLAAILMVASVRTADWQSLKLMPRVHWSYGAIMTITTILTVVRDLTIAVAVGVGLAAIVVIVKLASSPKGEEIVPHEDTSISDMSIHPDVQVVAFNGPLFFVGTENLRNQISEISAKPFLVLDFSNVPTMDETGAFTLRDLAQRLQREGKTLYIGGLKKKPLHMLTRMGLTSDLGASRVCTELESALRGASLEAAQTAEVESDSCVHRA